MAVIILDAPNFHFGGDAGMRSMQEQDLVSHIGTCLRLLPPKQLCRCLRESFMLRLEELQQTTPDFKNFVTQLTILLARLDALEDGNRRQGNS
jgi:hypothetical protein